ncbi:MAG: MerR family DNA-binding protein, partial [Longimicrobiales bacterium]|nr:MerR family DNA-binding protein [Longimicrobiales bacterium]
EARMTHAEGDHIWIGEVADAAGVGVETLRFYEREGLLPEPPRSDTGYRLYDDEAVRRVRFIRKARELGFTLSEIGELLDLRVRDASVCADVAERTRVKIASIEARIRELTRVRAVLAELEHACATNRTTSACPILDALDDPDVSPIKETAS